MGKKRKADEDRRPSTGEPLKRVKQNGEQARKKADLLFAPRPDWHSADIPPLQHGDATTLPPQRSIDKLHNYAVLLLDEESAAYNSTHMSASSSHKFLSTIMSSGTLEDKISALTLLVQESPLHNRKAFENLLGLSRKKSRNQALMALAALKDLLGQGVVLPGDRKLRAFNKQPAVLAALQGSTAKWSEGQPLPGGLQKIHLLLFAYEDWLKKAYFEILQVLESWLGDEVEYSRTRAITFVWELLRDKPEQEENLLRLLVNKLGDTVRKNASRASHLLLQLENSHPAMKTVITNSIEADCLFRPGQSQHAKYYGIVTLNQTILNQNEQEVANRLLEIYFSLFVQLLKPADKTTNPKANDKVQGGGGKPGKMAARKKREAENNKEESGDQLRDKMIAQILTGVNRAFPFADVNDPTFEKQLDTIFRVTHSANFNTAVQALVLIQQISSRKHLAADRFYRALYESLLDPRLLTSSKQLMYLNLLYKSLKQDLNGKRVQAFVKRSLQIITMHEPPFVCGVLFLISELESTFPSIRNMLTEPEEKDEDGEEHFVDVDENGDAIQQEADKNQNSSVRETAYDARKRDPEHAHADRSCLWELLVFLQHFHPSVALFAEALVFGKTMPPKPDPTQHTLMHFLDRFVYRSARSKASVSVHGTSIMQPMAGSSAADLLFKPSHDGISRPGAELNTERFWQKKVEDVAADEVFFHSYFNQAGHRGRKGPAKKKQREEDEDGSEDDGEDEIWKAITASKPEVDGMVDEDDDVDLDDLEGAFSDDDRGSQAGIDLGGEADDASDGGQGLVLDDGSEVDDLDDMLDLDSGGEDAMFDSEEDVPMDTAMAESDDDKGISASQKKRKERKKLKQLPTFASVEDYAKLLGDDDDDEEGM